MASPLFVGRRSELRDLHAAYQHAIEGQPGMVIVTGEAGIGKSRLVAEFSASVVKAGGRVLSGGCIDVTEDSLPYAPVIEAFRPLLRGNEQRRHDGDGGVGELARLLPALGASLGGVRDAAGEASPASSQSHLFEVALRVVDALSRQRPLLIVFEDIHWADRSTRELLAFLARNLRTERVLAVVTYRLDAVVRGHPLLPFLAELERSPVVTSLTLSVFGNEEVRAQVEAILGQPPTDRLVAQIRERSDGNAFFIEEILASGDHAGSVTPTLHEMLLARVNQLPAQAAEAVRAVAVCGRQATDEVVAQVSGLSERELVAALREAVVRGVLLPPEASAATDSPYRIRHALLREAVLEDLLPSERRHLHAGAAMALQRLVGATPMTATLAGELASHWSAAGRRPEALAASIQAGEAALATHAPAEAARHFAQASRLFPDVEGAERLAGTDESGLLERAGHAAFLAGDLADAVRLTRSALQHLGSADPTRRGMLERQLGSELLSLGDDAEAIAAMRRAVDLVPDAPTYERARVLCALGASLMLGGRFEESRRLCEQSLAAARAAGSDDLVAQSLNFVGVDLVNLGEIEAGLESLRAAVPVAIAGGSDTTIVEVHNNLAYMLDLADRPSEGIAVATNGLAEADRLGLGRAAGAGLRATAAGLLYRVGRWEEADKLIAEALQLDPQGAPSFGLTMYRAQMATARGRFADADTDIRAARRGAMLARRPAVVAYIHAAAAELAIWEGRLDDARAEVRAGLAALEGTDNKLGSASLLALGVRGEADRAEQARNRRETLGTREAATAAEPLVEAMHRLAVVAGLKAARPSVRANIAAVDAEWARLIGEPSSQAWSDVRVAWEEAGAPYFAAYAAFREAEAALARPGGHSAEIARLIAAHRSARELHAIPLVRSIQELAERARVSLEDRPATGGSPTGAAPPTPTDGVKRLGLTAREIEVLSFVARGMTNRQIASALFISPKTASVHVTNILGKLGVQSRFDASAVAQRLGLQRAIAQQQAAAADYPATTDIGGTEPAHDRVKRTFMFTDIVNSTMLMDAIGDEAWVTLRQWHDRSLRTLFERSKGQEVDHAGDGFFVVFEDPASAIRCAISIQRILADHRRSEGFAPRVRIGIHAGEAVRAGSAYSGLAVHTAARIAALAGAGEIVASSETADAAAAPAGSPQRVMLQGLATGVDVVRIDWLREPARG